MEDEALPEVQKVYFWPDPFERNRPEWKNGLLKGKEW